MADFTLEKTACNAFKLTKVKDTGNTAVVSIYRYNETIADALFTFNMVDDAIETFTLDDGYYTMKLVDAGFDNGSPQYVSILVMCSFLSCLNAMNENILCVDDCTSCQDCDEQALITQRLYQYEVNKMTILYWMIMGYINYEKGYDYSYYQSARQLLIAKIGKMMEKINTIAARCDGCS